MPFQFRSSSFPRSFLVVSSLILLIILSSSLLTSLVSAQVPTTPWQTHSARGDQVYRACSTPPTKTYCYKSFFGSYYFTCVNNADEQYVELHQCSNSSCTTGTCTSVRNFTRTSGQVASPMDGNRKLNWTGIYYTVAEGVISETAYDTSSSTDAFPVVCNDTHVKYRQFYPSSVDTCLPWVPYYHYASQRRYCQNSSSGGQLQAVHAQYLNTGDCANGSTSTSQTLFENVTEIIQVQFTTVESGVCSDDGDVMISCDNSTTGAATFAVFSRSSAGGGFGCTLLLLSDILFKNIFCLNWNK